MIEEIRAKIQVDQFELSKHAVDQSIIRHIRISPLSVNFCHKKQENLGSDGHEFFDRASRN